MEDEEDDDDAVALFADVDGALAAALLDDGVAFGVDAAIVDGNDDGTIDDDANAGPTRPVSGTFVE